VTANGAGLLLDLKGGSRMRASPILFSLALLATLVQPASAAPRQLELCSGAVQSCDCPRQARSCAPLCHIEPLIACHTI
jgi:hypothetical protein